MTRAWNIVALAMLLASCGGSPLVPPGPPVPSDADAVEQCDAICDRLELLRCEGWQGNAGPDELAGTDDDATCERACVDVQAVVALNAGCIVAAGSCEAVDDCEVE